MKSAYLLVLASSLPLLSACATTETGPTALGSEASPIKAFRPDGQRAYLVRLVCADGTSPTFARVGSFGQHRDGHIFDGFEVTCRDQPSRMIFMDMYHPGHVENRAPEGFSLASPPKA